MDWSKVRYFDRAEFGEGEPGIEPDEGLVRMLDEARHVSGIPYQITSGLRTKEHNAAVGGAPTSAHLTGHAVDIAALLGVMAVVMPVVVGMWGRAFARWADRLNTMGEQVNAQLEKMETKADKRWDYVDARMQAHDQRLHDIHVCAERRLARLEAKDQ